MRILHIIPSLDLVKGGVAQGVLNLTKYYQRFGVEASILTFDEPLVDSSDIEHLELIVLGASKFGTYSYQPKLVPWLKHNSHKYSAVVVDGLWQYHGLGVYQAFKTSKTPYYVFTHGMLDPWFKHNYPVKHLKKYIYWLFAQKAILENAKAVLFTSEDERKLARKSFWPYDVRECVVGYGTSVNKNVQQVDSSEFFRLYPRLKSKRILLFLGRIHEKKGCDLLIRAFATCAKEHADLNLVFAGPDSVGWKQYLIELSDTLGVSNRVVWTGMIKDEVKWGALKAAEAFVLPSHQENFGIAVAEALSVGTPVLISNKVNIWREVKDMDAGLIEANTLEGTQKLLTSWLRMPEDRKKVFCDNAKECYLRYFEISKASQRVIKKIKDDLSIES